MATRKQQGKAVVVRQKEGFDPQLHGKTTLTAESNSTMANIISAQCEGREHAAAWEELGESRGFIGEDMEGHAVEEK